MKIIYTTEQDFLEQEIAEHGFDYVDAQFALGYVPALINGEFWKWVGKDVHRVFQGDSRTSDIGGNTLPVNRTSVFAGLTQ